MDLNDDGPAQNPDPPGEPAPPRQEVPSRDVSPAEPVTPTESGGRSGEEDSTEIPKGLSPVVRYLGELFVKPVPLEERRDFALQLINKALIGLSILVSGVITIALVVVLTASGAHALVASGLVAAGSAALLYKKVASRSRKRLAAGGKAEGGESPAPTPGHKPDDKRKKKPKKG